MFRTVTVDLSAGTDKDPKRHFHSFSQIEHWPNWPEMYKTAKNSKFKISLTIKIVDNDENTQAAAQENARAPP